MDTRFVSLNVNSLVDHRRRFLLNDFIACNPAHVYFLQETKFGPNHKFSHTSFSMFSSNNRAGCGGAAMLVHSALSVRNVRRFSGEMDAVFAEVRLDDRWIFVGSVYLHPPAAELRPLEQFLNGHDHFIIGGDFNARHVAYGDVSTNLIGRNFFEMASDAGWTVLTPPSPTCYRSPDGSFIDKFVLDGAPLFTHSSIDVLPSFSDHLGISFTIHCRGTSLDVRNGFELRQFNYASMGKMNRFLEGELANLNLPIDSEMSFDEMEVAAHRIGKALSTAAVRFVPTKFVRLNGIPLTAQTRALQRGLRSAQRKLHRAKLGGAGLPTIAAIRVEVSLLRQMTLDAIGMDLSNHYRNAMADTTTMRAAHRTIITHTGYRKRTKCPGILYTDAAKGESISGDGEMAEGFLGQFARNNELTVGMVSDMDAPVEEFMNSLAAKTFQISFSGSLSPRIVSDLQLTQTDEKLPENMRGVLISVDDVARIVARAPAKKSTGPDEMPYFLFKRFSINVLVFLTIFFNHLLAKSYFPREWRHAIVTPIPKPHRDSSVIGNWRPISNLNCISKLFERLLARRLAAAVARLDILRNQFGFLREHSSTHALGRLQATIDDGLNDGRFTTLVSLDLRAAFDTVWHSGLLYKLHQLRLPLNVILMFRSFLEGRTFSVRLGKCITDARAMPSGTPQGAVCSPLLFNLFLYDIPDDDYARTLQFADDTSLYCTDNHAGRVQNGLNKQLVAVSTFFRRWKLLLNAEKTQLLLALGFAREASRSLRRSFQNIQICVEGHLLAPVNRMRLLGVIFDRNNRFVGHIDHVLARARASFGALRPVLRSNLIDPSIKTNVYKTYIRPIMTYAAPVWARPRSLSSHQMERLRAFERKILRMTANVRRPIGSFKFADNATLYEAAGCPRIDRFIVKLAVDFFRRCSESTVGKLNSLIQSIGAGRFNDLAYFWKRSSDDELLENGLLMDFHVPYSGNGRAVYPTGQ